jgi:hypothetical protein
MSDPTTEPTADEITYADTRDDQAEFQGLVEEEDGDFQEAVDAHQDGKDPEDPNVNPSMP